MSVEEYTSVGDATEASDERVELTPEQECDTRRVRQIGKQALRYGGAVFFGGLLALGINNLHGDSTEIGPLRITTHIKAGDAAGITSDAIDLRQERDSAMPIGAFADVRGTANTAMSQESLAASAAVIGDPAAVGTQLEKSYLEQAAIAAGIGGAAGGLLFGGLEWGLKEDRRKWIYTGLSIAALTGATATGYWPTHDFNAVPWQKTSFSIGGHTIKGSYAGSAGAEIKSLVEKNESTFNTIRKNMKQALVPVAAEDAKLRPDDVRINVYSDWHCNYGMARVLRQVNDSLKIKTTLNVGDNFLGQTDIESLCADVLGTNLKSTTNYVAPGNHDSNPLVKRMKDDGFKILEGTTANVAGATVLGFADPGLSPAYSHVDSPRDPNVTVKEFEANVVKKTCAIHPEILLVHDPSQVLEKARNCATATISGHTHDAKKPRYTGFDNVTLNDGSSGGAAPQHQSVAGLGQPATEYILYVRDGTPVGARLLTAYPDTSVKVDDYIQFNSPLQIPTGHSARRANPVAAAPKQLVK